MSISRGTGSIKRVHAKNFTHDEVQKRMDEAVRPYQQQGLNALKVDSFEVLYYKRVDSTSICTCKSFTLPDTTARQTTALSPALDIPGDVRPTEVVIDYARPLFGTATPGAVLDVEDVGDSDELSLDSDRAESSVSPLFSSSANCGICYKCGYLPAYEKYGHQRYVLTTYDVEDTYGYNTDMSKSPVVLNMLDEREGYVDYVILVPFYFESVSISIRANTDHLKGELLYDSAGGILTLQHFRNAAGKELRVRCRATSYTHVVVEFDLGHKLRANLAQSSKESDWSKFNTLANVQFIMPMTIKDVTSSDVFHVPKRNLTFKVSEVQYLRTSNGENLDWSLGTRVLQPQEALAYIHWADVVV